MHNMEQKSMENPYKRVLPIMTIEINLVSIEFRDEQEEFPPTQDELVALSSERIVVADSECIIEAGFLEIINDGVSKSNHSYRTI